MRVLFVSHQSAYIYGGETVTLAAMRALKSRGVEVEFAAPPGPYFERARALGIPVHEIPAIEFSRSLSLLPSIALAWTRTAQALRKIVRERGIELAHANTLKAMVYAGTLSREIPVVWHHHDILPDTSANALWARFLAARAAKVLTPSHAARDALVAAGIRPEHVQAVWNGFAPYEWSPRPTAAPGSAFVIGFVGELSPRKGADYLAPIAAALEPRLRAPFVIRVIGAALSDPDFGASVEADCAPWVARGVVEFLGRREDVKHLYQNMDVLILPSRQDPFPTVILEAAFSGVPAVARPVGGVTEMIRQGENGYYADTPEDFAIRLQSLAAKRRDCAKLGATARDFAESNFSLERMAEDLMDVYRECLETGSRRRRR